MNELKRAHELLPDDPNVIEHLGDVYLKIGDNKKAVEYYQKAAKIDPKNSAVKKKLDNLMIEK